MVGSRYVEVGARKPEDDDEPYYVMVERTGGPLSDAGDDESGLGPYCNL